MMFAAARMVRYLPKLPWYGCRRPGWDTMPAPLPPPPPQVASTREMVITVGFGGAGGCTDEYQIIGRIQVYRDTLQVVRLPRSDLPVLFLGPWAGCLNEQNLLSAEAKRDQ